jgi:hypothetical protein
MPKHHCRPSTGKSPPKETAAPIVVDAADDSGSSGTLPYDANSFATILKGALLMLETIGWTSLLLEPCYNLIWLLHEAAIESTPEYRTRTIQAFLNHYVEDNATQANTILALTNTNAELVKQNKFLTDALITSNVNAGPKARPVNTHLLHPQKTTS